MRRTHLLICSALGLAFILFPQPVEAHLNSTGMGPLYDGLMHARVEPGRFRSVLALALLVGLRGAAADGGERSLSSRWRGSGGVTAGTWAAARAANPISLPAGFFSLEGCSLLMPGYPEDVHWPGSFTRTLSGYLNGSGMGELGTSAVALLGLVFAVFVQVALAASLVVQMQVH
ncbi:MAG: hypothetical protein U0V70_16205 [Terriglobia bacterium]